MKLAPRLSGLRAADRLSPLDSAFLRLETPSAHMHVGWLALLELPDGETALDVDALRAQIIGRLPLAPRFRQRIVPAPLGVAEPAWVDHHGFDGDEHIRVLPDRPRPLSRGELDSVCDEFLSVQLSRARPLWEILLVPRLEGGRAAMIGKVHHAMVDGLAAVELGKLLFDDTPKATSGLPAPAAAEPAMLAANGAPRDAPALGALVGALTDGALAQLDAAQATVRLLRTPRRALETAGTVRRAAVSLGGDILHPAPRSFLNRDIGPRRTLIVHRLDLDRLKQLKLAAGATLNDVVLAIIAGALRALGASCGDDVPALRTMVPVSVRHNGDPRAQGNRITFGFIEIPLGEPNAAARLALVRSAMLGLRGSGKIRGSELLLRSVGLMPGPVKSFVARLTGSPRMYNVTVSSVPGPRGSVYAAGVRMVEIYPVIPLSEGHALSVGALTYERGLHVAAYADPDALPQVTQLPDMLEQALSELERAVLDGGVRV